VLGLAGFKPGQEVKLEVRPDRIIIRLPGDTLENEDINQSHQEAKKVWDQAFEDMWFQLYGPEE
jgi:hypothetical protein